MIENYKEYNNLSQQNKESAIAKAAEDSNTNETTIIANTDEVESLLRTVIQRLDSIDNHVDEVENKLDAIESDLTTVNSSVGGVTHEVTSQGQAIVQAIQGQ